MSGAEKRAPVITIDGPAGAGKSTVARELAQRLALKLVDTGALYRGIAWATRQAGIAPEEGPALRGLLDRTTVDLSDDRVLVDGRDVTDEIRTPEITALTSRLTTLGPVRDKMTPFQRALAAQGGVVLEGRDTGTVVWPEAEIKFYLDADLETRAFRRQKDLRARGVEMELGAVADELDRRDRQDMSRALAPLTRPGGAVVLDSTGLSIDGVLEAMLKVVEQAWCCTRS